MLRVKPERLDVSVGFWLLLAWFTVVNGWRITAEVLGAAIVHEFGHWMVLHLLNAHVQTVRINVLGAVMEADCRSLSYGKELAAVLAGPTMNFLCAAVLAHFSLVTSFVGAHLVLGAFNLLPVWPLDGGRALNLLALWLFGPEWGDRISLFVSRILSAALAAGLSWLMVRSGGSLWLLPPTVGILLTGWRRRQ